MVKIQLQWTLFLSLYCVLTSGDHHGHRKTFIVHMNKLSMPTPFTNHLHWYSSLIQSATFSPHDHDDTDNPQDERLIYTYHSAFNGIAARLTHEEAQRLQSVNGVMSISQDTKYQLQTTRSPTFLGLEPKRKKTTKVDNLIEQNVIVGVIDTGIWPESESFNDAGLPPAPEQWKGSCEEGQRFKKHHCNNKIIGARSFYRGYESANGGVNEEDEYRSPRDHDGHGTHTAATVAGSPVHGANLFGYGNGTSRGMSPAARIAAYKVCWSGGCYSSDVLSAVDQAVHDGVNVLSISLGGGAASYYRDYLSIATFGAMELGVFVSCAAGNDGAEVGSVTNVSPWMMTVGASTIDREFPATVRLGSGEILAGASVYNGRRKLSPEKMYSLVYLGNNKNNNYLTNPNPSSLCMEGMLDKHLVVGKIVVCDRGVNSRVQKGQVVKDSGGIGMILCNSAENGGDMVADSHLLPAVAVGEEEGRMLKEYVVKDRNPTANLVFLQTKVGVRPSPVVAAFSSRGPSAISAEILKPDVVAPGVNILAAWTGGSGPSGAKTDHRRVRYNILSGTSMSCPHVSGVAAWVMARNPAWSPAAIKSALMTTAYVHDNTLEPLTDSSTGAPSGPYDHGAGHINPTRALDPGLVYDIEPQDYFEFLCTQGLTKTDLMVFATFSNRTCKGLFSNPGDLNYPALSVVFPRDESVHFVRLKRTVTNVGPANSRYRVRISRFKGVDVKVEPRTLIFVKKNEKLSYEVTFTMKYRQVTPEFGGLIWNDGKHRVRSPIVIT